MAGIKRSYNVVTDLVVVVIFLWLRPALVKDLSALALSASVCYSTIIAKVISVLHHGCYTASPFVPTAIALL